MGDVVEFKKPVPQQSGAKLRHDWMPSTLNHGTLQCKHCLVTDKEAAVIAPEYCLLGDG